MKSYSRAFRLKFEYILRKICAHLKSSVRSHVIDISIKAGTSSTENPRPAISSKRTHSLDDVSTAPATEENILVFLLQYSVNSSSGS